MLARSSQTLTIPEATLSFSGDSTFVFVVTDSTARPQQFQRRAITTGISDGVNIEVKSGLKKDERVRGIEIIAE